MLVSLPLFDYNFHISAMSKKVLIVEDNEQLRRMYERVFELHHCAVDSCADGEQALQLLRAETDLPSVIVLDAMLPGIDGMGVLRALKSDQKLAAIPVIILTNSIREDKKEEYLKAGAAQFLVKMNTSPEQIIKTLEDVCSGICNPSEPV